MRKPGDLVRAFAPVLFVLFTPPLMASDWPASVTVGGDTIKIEESQEGAAQVLYNNSLEQSSRNETHTLSFEGVVVDVTIEIVPGGPERITVEPHDAGLVAYPEEALIEDGEYTVIQILYPMF